MIRPQYHFRQGPNGLRAWNVARLIRLSAALPVREVPLGDLKELDEAYWFDTGTAQMPTVRAISQHARLISEVDSRYPIILCAEGRVMDGMHRVARCLIEDRLTVPARQFLQTPDHDFEGVAPEDLPYEKEGFEL